MVKWLGLGVFMVKDLGSIPGRGIRILHASWGNQKKKKKERNGNELVDFYLEQ